MHTEAHVCACKGPADGPSNATYVLQQPRSSRPLSTLGSAATMADEEKPKFDAEQINLKVKDQARGSACAAAAGALHPRDAAAMPAACPGGHLGCVSPQVHVVGTCRVPLSALGLCKALFPSRALLTPGTPVTPLKDGGEVQFKVKKSTKFSKVAAAACSAPLCR